MRPSDRNGSALAAFGSRVRSRFTGPAARVGILAAGLGCAALILCLTVVRPERPIQSTFSVPAWMLVIGFGLAEVAVVHLVLSRNAHSISLAEVPMVFGLFFVSPLWFVAARVLGSAVALVVHRRQRGI